MTKYPVQIIPPNPRIQLVDAITGILKYNGLQFLQQVWAAIVNTSQITPCTCTNSTNVYTLTPFPTPPAFQQQPYADFQMYSFVSNHTSTGLVTALVAGLATIKVFKTNGSAQATTGDITSGLHYLFTYVSTLDSGNGGFVLR